MNGTKANSLAGTQSRIATILASKEMRLALAERASRHELSTQLSLAFSSDAVAEHLMKERTTAEHEAFFNSRRVSEAIILQVGRPVLLVRDGLIEKAALPEVEATLKNVRKALSKPIASVGRIELSDHDTYEWCGTGWRVEDDFIITNRHVAQVFSLQQGRFFRFRINQAGKGVRARIDFREEYQEPNSEEFGIAEILWIAEDNDAAPDMAVLRVRKDPGLPAPILLAKKDAVASQQIGVVGYPARDSRNDAELMAQIFRDIYDVKRFAPGTVVTPGTDTWYLTHDASTLGGNSGSAVLDLASGDALGLHFGGSFRKTNYAVKASAIKNILAQRSWIAVSPIPSITVEEFKETERTKEYMKGRVGYRENFLGKTVGLPKPGASHSILETGTAGNLLPYTHFSIMMSQSRRFPIFTAENLDGSLKIRLKRNDCWGFDPRIAEDAQVGHAEFYGPEPFDKGHMVRRENSGWGKTKEEAELGEKDTFVFTNAIPQMPQLNQQTWLSLENYILDHAKTDGFQISVFTGPAFRDDDPSYSGVQVPLDFWKVVVAIDEDTKDLLASAYLLSQEGLMPKEGFRYGEFKTYQVPVKKIEQVADLKFPKQVQDADVFGQSAKEILASNKYLEITSVEDIVLQKPAKI